MFKELFIEWKKREIHKNSVFIEDGIIDVDYWNQSKVKTLFLLKEAYSPKNVGFDLCSLVRQWLIDDNIPRKGGTWPNIARWSYGIKHTIYSGATKQFPDRRQERLALREVAVVNIKKSCGKRSSKREDLISYIDSDFDLLMKQINLIRPNVVVCANTFGLIKSNLLEDIKKISDRVYWHRRLECFFVDFWHPAAIFPHQLTYHALCSLVAPIKLNIEH